MKTEAKLVLLVVALISFFISYRIGAYRMFCLKLNSVVLLPHIWFKPWYRQMTWILTMIFSFIFAGSVALIFFTNLNVLSVLIFLLCLFVRYLASRFRGVGRALVLKHDLHRTYNKR